MHSKPLILLVLAALCAAADLARGWNSAINWVSWKDAQSLAKEANKPIMMVIHKSWCGACKSLKPQFAADKSIEELSSQFVMVNLLDDEEPSEAIYKPDGGYIPRILFLRPDGSVMNDVVNPANPKYKYYYPQPQMIVTAMNSALERVGAAASEPQAEL